MISSGPAGSLYSPNHSRNSHYFSPEQVGKQTAGRCEWFCNHWLSEPINVSPSQGITCAAPLLSTLYLAEKSQASPITGFCGYTEKIMCYPLTTLALLIMFIQTDSFALKPELSIQTDLFSTFPPNIAPGTRQDGLSAVTDVAGWEGIQWLPVLNLQCIGKVLKELFIIISNLMLQTEASSWLNLQRKYPADLQHVLYGKTLLHIFARLSATLNEGKIRTHAIHKHYVRKQAKYKILNFGLSYEIE